MNPNSPIMRWFSFAHLPDTTMRLISEQCCTLAEYMDHALDSSAEKSAGLRKLLEAKDCFVRAAKETSENMTAPYGGVKRSG